MLLVLRRGPSGCDPPEPRFPLARCDLAGRSEDSFLVLTATTLKAAQRFICCRLLS